MAKSRKMQREAGRKIHFDIFLLQSVADRLGNLGQQVQILPPFHYQHGSTDISEVQDILGRRLIGVGLKAKPLLDEFDFLPEWEEKTFRRFYASEESQGSLNGFPVTTITSYRSFSPEYVMVRDDGTYTFPRVESKGNVSSVVTTQLAVHNPMDVPSFIMGCVSGLPVYDRARDVLFDFSKEFPLVDDKKYLTYMERFRELDSWLITSRVRKK